MGMNRVTVSNVSSNWGAAGAAREKYNKGVLKMAEKVTFDYAKAAKFIGENELAPMEKLVKDAKEVLVSRTGAGSKEDRQHSFP